MVHTDQLEVSGVVAFISGAGRLNDPWGDLVNHFRDFSLTQVKYNLVADSVTSSPIVGPPFRPSRERHCASRLEKFAGDRCLFAISTSCSSRDRWR
jgi:hypothetical protein